MLPVEIIELILSYTNIELIKCLHDPEYKDVLTKVIKQYDFIKGSNKIFNMNDFKEVINVGKDCVRLTYEGNIIGNSYEITDKHSHIFEFMNLIYTINHRGEFWLRAGKNSHLIFDFGKSVKKIAVLSPYVMALILEDNMIGSYDKGSFNIITTDKHIIDIGMTPKYVLLIDEMGSLWESEREIRDTPRRVALPPIVSIKSSYHGVVFLDINGDVWIYYGGDIHTSIEKTTMKNIVIVSDIYPIEREYMIRAINTDGELIEYRNKIQ